MPVKIFFCYAHEDEDLLNKLKRHLSPLQHQGLIDVWHDRDISAGTKWEQEISQHLNAAQIILLLVSPDFMYSEYCYSVEMKRALERHEAGEARVIPIIVRHVYWQEILGQLQALPTDAKPVRSALWYNEDEALLDVTKGIRKVVVQLSSKPVSPSEVLPSQASKRELADSSLTIVTTQPAPSQERSFSLRVAIYDAIMAIVFIGSAMYFAQFIILFPLPFHLSDNIHVFSINTFNVTRQLIADAIIGLILLGLYMISMRAFLTYRSRSDISRSSSHQSVNQ